MTEDDDIDGLAGEYVLGSLSAAERAEVDARRKTDPVLDAAVRAWEKRLAPLGEGGADIAPPAHVWDGITARIARPTAQVIALPIRPRPSVWRRAAVVSGLLAACIALLVVWLNLPPATLPSHLIADLHSATADETSTSRGPVFLVAVDLDARSIVVRPVAARPRAGRSYQLWITRQGSRSMESLGVISHAQPTTLPLPAGHPNNGYPGAALSVSLEPEGGSPTAAPTGPVILVGKLTPDGKS